MSGKRPATPRNRVAGFLLDENISSDSIAIELRKLRGWRIEMHQDHFDPGAEDVRVVTLCAQKGWGLLTCDDMRYSHETSRAIFQGGVKVFKVITHRETHGVQMSSAIVVAQQRLLKYMATPGALCAHIRMDGSVHLMTTFSDYAKLTPAQTKTFKRMGKLF